MKKTEAQKGDLAKSHSEEVPGLGLEARMATYRNMGVQALSARMTFSIMRKDLEQDSGCLKTCPRILWSSSLGDGGVYVDLGPQTIEIRVFANGIKLRILRCRHPTLEWALIPRVSVLIRDGKGEDAQLPGEAREGGGRDRRQTAPSQGMPGTIHSWKRPGRSLPLEPSREHGPLTSRISKPAWPL